MSPASPSTRRCGWATSAWRTSCGPCAARRPSPWSPLPPGGSRVRVLMIGGTGLIGSAVVRQLLEAGHEVTAYGRGRSPRQLPAGVRELRGDRTLPAFAEDMAAAGTFDCVVDMVCYRPQEAETAVQALSGRTGQYVLTSTVDVYRKPAHRY